MPDFLNNKLVRPDCFDFAMDFLGEPQATEVRKYVEALENTQGVTMQLDFSKPELLQTRDGREVRIYATDHEEPYCISGAVFCEKQGRWNSVSWQRDGLATGCSCFNCDLIPKTQRITGWLNISSAGHIQSNRVFESQYQAKEAACVGCLGQAYIDAEVQP